MAGAIALRDVAPGDLPTLYAHQLDPVATALAAFPSRDWPAFAAHWSRILADPSCIARAILCGDQVAGNIGSYLADGRREVGYWLGREYWGRGIATAALARFLTEVTERPLYAHVVRHNVASRRVLEKCGFAVCGEDVLPASVPGEAVEELVLRLG